MGPAPQVSLPSPLIRRKLSSPCALRRAAVTHAWAAGQFSRGEGLSRAVAQPPELSERWDEKVLEGSPGSRQQELPLHSPPASQSPHTQILP